MPVSTETLVKEHGDSLPQQAVELFRSGLSMQQSHLYDQAGGQYANLLANMRNHPAAWAVRWNLGECLHAVQRFEEAVEQFDLALEIRPQEAGLWLCRGNSLAGLGRFDDSVASLQKASQLEPGNTLVKHHLGMAMFDQGRRQEATPVLLEGAASLQESARAAALVRAAAGLFEQGQQDPAQDCLAEAWTALREDTGDEWVSAGVALARAGRPEMARPFLEQGLKRTPCREASQAAARLLGLKLERPMSFVSLGPAPTTCEELESTVADEDGYHLAFLTPGELRVDDQRIPRNSPDCHNLAVSCQGEWAAAMSANGKWYGVKAGQPVAGPFDTPPHIMWSSTGRLAVIGRKAVFLDGVAGPQFDDIATLVFSPDGKRCAYLGRKGSRFHVVLDGKSHAGYEGVSTGEFLFSPDSRHFAYVAQEKGKQAVVLDGKAGKWYRGAAGIAFSGDGQHMVHYGGRSDGQATPVLDGKEIGSYDFTGDFQLDQAGKTLVFFTAGKHLMVNGQQVSQDYADLYEVRVSPDGRHYGCFAERAGKWHAFLDGTESTAWDDVRTGTLKWNEGRQQWHYVATMGGRLQLVEGDRPGRAYDDFAQRPPQVSAHGKIAFAATRNGSWYVVLDGLESEPFETVIMGPGFRGETMHALVVRRGVLERMSW